MVATGFEADEPRRPPRVARTVAFVVAMVVASAVGFVYVRKHTGGLSYPRTWDPRVTAIAEFVGHERGRPFKHPVSVDFLTSEQYRGAVLSGDDMETVGDGTGTSGRMTDDDFVARFRAVGLVSGRVDLHAVTDTLADAGTLAFYSPRDHRVRVRGSEMTPGLRVTLAHELTHALQDQYFDLSAKRLAAESSLRPIIEGDATRIQRAYEAQVLTDAERAEKASADEAERATFTGQLAASNVPSVLSTAFELPYALGPQFVEIAAALGGNTAVDALISRPPSTDVPLLDPLRTDTGSTPRSSVPDPPLPAGAEALDRSPMGAGLLFLLLGERMEPAAALDVASTWTGEASVVSRQQGRICFDADFRTDGRAGGALLIAMTAWAAGMPAQAGAEVSGDENAVRVHTCDPGTEVAFTVSGRTEQTLTYAAIRSDIALDLVRDAHVAGARSECIADQAARSISAADLANGSFATTVDPDLLAAVQQAATRC